MNKEKFFNALNSALREAEGFAGNFGNHQRILLCGSRATLTHREESDVDLLVPAVMLLAMQYQLKYAGFVEEDISFSNSRGDWTTQKDFRVWSLGSMHVDLIVPRDKYTWVVSDPKVQEATPLKIFSIPQRMAWEHTLLHDSESFEKWRKAVEFLRLEDLPISKSDIIKIFPKTGKDIYHASGGRWGSVRLGDLVLPPPEMGWQRGMALEAVQEYLRQRNG